MKQPQPPPSSLLGLPGLFPALWYGSMFFPFLFFCSLLPPSCCLEEVSPLFVRVGFSMSSTILSAAMIASAKSGPFCQRSSCLAQKDEDRSVRKPSFPLI